MPNEIKATKAVKAMRNLTKLGIPFSIGFHTYSKERNESKGYRKVEKALLRKSFRTDQSIYADTIINYIDCSDDTPKSFHLCNLYEFEGIKVVL